MAPLRRSAILVARRPSPIPTSQTQADASIYAVLRFVAKLLDRE